MTESRARKKFQAILRRAKKGLCDTPTLFHIAKDGKRIKGVEVRGNNGLLWAWPRGFRSGLDQAEQTAPWSRFDMKAREEDRWNFTPIGQAL